MSRNNNQSAISFDYRLDLEMSGKLDAKEVKIATPHGNSEISSQ